MKKRLTIILLLCISCLSMASAERIPYFEFSQAVEVAPRAGLSASPSPSPSPAPTSSAASSAYQLIEDFQIPLAPGSEGLMPEITMLPEGAIMPTSTPLSPTSTPQPTPPPALYPKAILDVLQVEGISPDDVIDLEKWWLTAKEGETCAVKVGECVTVNGEFYKVIAECPPFEKTLDMNAFDLTTLINFMTGLFLRIYP